MKCNICGKLFIPKNQNRYLTAEPTTLANSLNGGGAVYDTFDCPRCGCQHRVGIRYNKCSSVEETEQDSGGTKQNARNAD